MGAIQWTCSEVADWLKSNGFDSYSSLLCQKHKVDGKVLLTLTEQDLREPPLQISVLGDIKRLMISLRQLQKENRAEAKNLGLESSRDLNGPSRSPARRTRTESFRREWSHTSEVDDVQKRYSTSLEPEYTKLFLSYVYMFAVFLCTAFAMVVVHDRVPDMKKYPPLPDIVLDNMPLIPWAFDMCEITALILSVFLFITLFFHKHRFIILRRLFSLTGTVFLLRCFSMLITSLSVPGTHLQCQPKMHDSTWSKLESALVIWKGFGMSLQGVRTCGDYMFSGHTVVVTMLNFFITEYTPRKMYLLHTTCWVLNLFGIFFILAAHEHYSIDVFIAFYLTSRLFLYYHVLANNRALRQPDHQRTRVWFPLFSFFESKVDGIVPNEFEWPWPRSWRESCQKKNL